MGVKRSLEGYPSHLRWQIHDLSYRPHFYFLPNFSSKDILDSTPRNCPGLSSELYLSIDCGQSLADSVNSFPC